MKKIVSKPPTTKVLVILSLAAYVIPNWTMKSLFSNHKVIPTERRNLFLLCCHW